MLRALFDTRFRSLATPGLISWIYRGCLTGIVVMTVWGLLVAAWVLTWPAGWLWGLLLLGLVPVVGGVLVLCVRVALELVVVRFREVDPPAAGPAVARPGVVAPGVGDAARSVIRSLRRFQGGSPVATEHPADPHEDPDDAGVLDLEAYDDVVPGAQTPPDTGRGEGAGTGPVWVAAAAVGVVLLVLVAAALVVSGGGDQDPRAASPATSTAASSAVVAPPPPASMSAAPAAPTAEPSPSSSDPVTRWRGTVTLTGPTSLRDLDAVPPRQSTRDGEPDIRGDWIAPMVEAESDAQVALAAPGSRPGALECRDTAGAAGGVEVEVEAGDVVCVLTDQGTVARLTITRATQTSRAPIVAARVVIWQMPGSPR